MLAALNDDRVETLVVPLGAPGRGYRCTLCGCLAVRDGVHGVRRGQTEPVPDVVESAVASALSQELPGRDADGHRGQRQRPDVGALLRF